MNIIPANAQHIGKRLSQQDAFAFSDNTDLGFVLHSGLLAVLCDGMGGMALGDKASNLAVQGMLMSYMEKASQQTIPEALQYGLQAANQAVLKMARKAGMVDKVGTTLAAAVVHNEQLYWISVGDSRIYLLRDGIAIQITEDHNYAMELEWRVQQGQMSREQAIHDSERHSLVSYLGMPNLPYVSINTGPMPLQSGDVILLCSDGLYGSLAHEEIVKVMMKFPRSPESLIQAVLDKAYLLQDNITVAMLTCETEDNRKILRKLPIKIKYKNGSAVIGLLLLGVATAVVTYYIYL